jgi:hypothetical protein
LDVARSPDGDKTVFAFAKDKMLLPCIERPGQKITETCGLAVDLIKEFGPASIRIDDGAAGGGVVDFLLEEQEKPDADWKLRECQIIAVNFGSRASEHHKYFDWRTEAWWLVGQMIENHELGLPEDATLFSQLTAPAMVRARDGRLKLESKDSLRARGIRSPDRADAAVLALYPSDPWFRACAW